MRFAKVVLLYVVRFGILQTGSTSFMLPKQENSQAFFACRSKTVNAAYDETLHEDMVIDR